MKKILISVLLLFILLAPSLQALELTDDPATMAAISMATAQWLKNQEIGYWEGFWIMTTISVAKEISDQAARREFDSGHIGINLFAFSLSWFIVDF